MNEPLKYGQCEGCQAEEVNVCGGCLCCSECCLCDDDEED